MFLKPVILSTAITLAACVGAATPPTFGAEALHRTSAAPFERSATGGRPLNLAGHLYVATNAEVYRYKVINGVPASTPDLVIDAGYFGGPIAVSGEGDLYAVSGRNLPTYAVVGVFEPGATKPKRTLTVSSGCGIVPVSLAVDGAGHLFVSYNFYNVGLRKRFASSDYCQGILVYGPHASGNDAPVTRIAIPGYDDYDNVLFYVTLDSSGNLITDRIRSNDQVGVGEFTDPTMKAHLSRRFWSSRWDGESGLAQAPGNRHVGAGEGGLAVLAFSRVRSWRRLAFANDTTRHP